MENREQRSDALLAMQEEALGILKEANALLRELTTAIKERWIVELCCFAIGHRRDDICNFTANAAQNEVGWFCGPESSGARNKIG
jgi:hypothetical protein